MCEISHQSVLNVGVVGDTTQDLGTLEGSFWVGAAVVQIPARAKHVVTPSLIKVAFVRVVCARFQNILTIETGKA